MRFSSFKRALAVVAFSVGMVTAVGCSDDAEKTEEPVTTDTSSTEAAPPPVEPAPAVSSFTPETVYFGFDDYSLSNDAHARLQSLGDHLKASPNTVVQIEGHCDERGSTEYNLALGERRAQSVKKYLSEVGVDPARLSTISYGEEKPAVGGHDEGAWQKNRRAEFTLTTN